MRIKIPTQKCCGKEMSSKWVIDWKKIVEERAAPWIESDSDVQVSFFGRKENPEEEFDWMEEYYFHCDVCNRWITFKEVAGKKWKSGQP